MDVHCRRGCTWQICTLVARKKKLQDVDKIVACNGLQSKRPQVKTSPSQNVPELVKTSPKIGQNVPMVKNVGQNVPKIIFIIYFM